MIKQLTKIVLLAICLQSLTYAKSAYEAQNGDTINATIAANDLTRIEVDGQKIIKDYSSANVSKKISQPLGQIYLIPNTNSTFNLYLVSDSGNTYNLRLTPSKNQAGDSIIIKPATVANKKPVNIVKHTESSYVRNINYLLELMYLNKADDNQYNATDINQPIVTYRGLDSVLLKKYTSDNLNGYVILLKNTAKTKVLLTEAEFYLANTLAIAIEQPNLAVNKFTRVFIIKEGE